jgi:flagellar capping protein FliD
MGGVHSGIDYSVLIDGMMAAEYRPYSRMQDDVTSYQAKSASILAIRNSVTGLKNQVADMRSIANLQAVTSSTSDSAVVGISTVSGALPGSHIVTVNQLASSQRIVHDAGTSYQDTKVGTGGSISTSLNTNTVADADAAWFTAPADGATYKFQIGGEDEINVTFESNKSYSLNDVISLINVASQETSGYDAASLSGAGPYQLAFTAKTRGAGELTATLDDGTAIAELDDPSAWNNTDGTDVSTGAFVYTYDGQSRTIYTTSDTTLAGLAGLINNDGSNPGVSANIIKHDGTYHLVLAGDKTGADYTITIDDANTTINGFDTADFTTAQNAQDAQFRIDGYPDPADPTPWMSSSSNNITDVLPGTTLSLTGTGETTVTLSRDDSSITSSLQGIVNAYNRIADAINLHMGYDTETKTPGDLQGDSTMRGVMNAIRNALTGVLPGFNGSTDDIAMASNVGLEIDKEGQLSLDTDVLNNALQNNYDDVVQFLGADQRGVTDSSYLQFNSALDSTEQGIYEVKADFDGSGTLTAAWIRNSGETSWRAATINGDKITGVTGNAEAGLEVTVTLDGASTSQTHEVKLQQGLGGAIYDVVDELTSSTGPFEIRDNAYSNAIDKLYWFSVNWTNPFYN